MPEMQQAVDEGAGYDAVARDARKLTMTVETTAFLLYQRDDCHLCDLALAVLAEARCPAFTSVFIDENEALEAEYGHRVPVLRDAVNGVELDWPFDADAVLGLIDDEN